MKTSASKFLTIAVLASTLSLYSCEGSLFGPKSDINDPDAKQGGMSLSITDAPIDNAEVTGAFVTITEIKIDGQTFNGFSGPKTVNLLALQNGNSLNLATNNVAVGSYSKIQLVISSAKDESGNAPGCYISKTDGTKETLELSGNNATEIEIRPKNFEVKENQNLEIIMDFDLRKAIKTKNNDYAFVSNGELSSAVRAEVKTETGRIVGKIDNANASGSKLVVYAYQKGTFNANTETKGQGNSDVMFAKAVTSAKVDANGNFTLSYLPQGEYEIHCEKKTEGGLLSGLETLVQLNSSSNLQSIPVSAGTEVSLNLSLKIGGLLGLL